MKDSYLNSVEFYLHSSFWSLWAGSVIFTCFFLYMIYLKPKLWSLDFGWTMTVLAVDILFIVSLWNQHYPESALQFPYLLFIASMANIFTLVALLLTFGRFVYDTRCNKANKPG